MEAKDDLKANGLSNFDDSRVAKTYIIILVVIVVAAILVFELKDQPYDWNCQTVNASVLNNKTVNFVNDSLWPEFTTYQIREANGTVLLCEKVLHAEKA